MDTGPVSGFPTGSLRPTTSYAFGRDDSMHVSPFVMEISRGLFTTSREPEPEHLPPLWTAHIHPEGQLYFVRQGPLRVVTEAYLYRADTLNRVSHCIDYIKDRLSSADTPISERTELFIKLEGEDCAYYLVDHTTRTQFWLETCDTIELELPPVVSASQLKFVLEELYWLHVGRFPMHQDLLSSQTLEEITSIFYHGLYDQMTSRVSTFPYTAQECHTFLALLKGCRDRLNNGYTTLIIARLWASIQHNMYVTHHGQEHARLSRDQSILFDREPEHYWFSSIFGFLTFGTSDMYHTRLDDVFVDHVVYSDHWERLIGDCLRDWKTSGSLALSGLMLNMPLLTLKFPVLLSAGSIALFASGLVSYLLLTHRYEQMQGITSTRAMNYLDTIQSPSFKFQFVALLFSLPKTLVFWGFLVFLVNCLLMAAEHLGRLVVAVFVALAFFIIYVLYCTTSEAAHALCTKVNTLCIKYTGLFVEAFLTLYTNLRMLYAGLFSSNIDSDEA